MTGPSQPPCLSYPNSADFVATYGDFLFTTAGTAAEEMAAADPKALLVTGALEMVPTRDTDLTLTTEYLISRGLLADHSNVAIGIHQYPYFYPPPWMRDAGGGPLNCAYYQPGHDIFWLPRGCKTSPPLQGSVELPRGAVPVRQLWERQDLRVDLSGLLRDAQALGVLDRFYMFDTELHAGFHDADPTTTPAREGLAGLRITAINAHQRVLGSEFIFAPADPSAYNLLLKHLAGTTPVYAWDAPLLDADYSGLVYKLFTRGNEDIIAVWSNAEEPLNLQLPLSPEAGRFRRVTLTRFAEGQLAVDRAGLDVPPAAIGVRPLVEFCFLSVIGDRPGFGWLSGIAISGVAE